jgi:MSHA biogenesis protein MshE
MRLGEALVVKGFLADEQLEEALAHQRSTGHRFTQVLLDKGFVSAEQIAQTLADTHGLQFVDLIQFEVVPAVAQKLPEALARKHRAIVLEDHGHTYLVGVVDPSNLPAHDYVSSVLGRRLEMAVVSDDHLAATIDRVYSTGERLNEFARAVESDVERDRNVVNLNPIVTSVSDAYAPVVKLLQTIFKEAAQLCASDIHIEPKEKKLIVR